MLMCEGESALRWQQFSECAKISWVFFPIMYCCLDSRGTEKERKTITFLPSFAPLMRRHKFVYFILFENKKKSNTEPLYIYISLNYKYVCNANNQVRKRRGGGNEQRPCMLQLVRMGVVVWNAWPLNSYQITKIHKKTRGRERVLWSLFCEIWNLKKQKTRDN